MKKLIAMVLPVLFIIQFTRAQTKVFKEVDEEISSQMKTITQDNALVGYLVFTRLEKATEDSFNYKITIMDENLNDIGALNFRETALELQDVSFTHDVLCLGYLKSNFNGNIYKKNKEYDAAVATMQNEVFTQFVSLDGKILKTTSIKVDLTPFRGALGQFDRRGPSSASLEHKILLQNVEQKGFACFYGDKNSSYLLVFSTKGDITWQRKINKPEGQSFLMLTTGWDIYLLVKKKDPPQPGWHWLGVYSYGEGGYELLGYSTEDTTSAMDYTLKDKRLNKLNVLSFENDPLTGKPYLAGLIIKPKKTDCVGVFTIDVGGVKPEEIKSINIYWDENMLPTPKESRRFEERMANTAFLSAFKDFTGNTYYAAYSSSTGAELLIQNSSGVLSVADKSLTASRKAFSMGAQPLYDERTVYQLLNEGTKTCYLITDDEKDILIYNIEQKKLLRTIPHQDGNIKTNVFPAKEGYIMISEYNRKEKYTKFSIEAL